MDASVAAAVKSATAMEHSVEQARINAVAELRAYIAVELKNPTQQLNGFDQPFQVELVIKNKGKTPAHRLRVRPSLAVMDYPTNPRTNWEPDPFPAVLSVSVIAPGDQLLSWAKASGMSDPSELDAVSKGAGKRLYAWGTVDYVDAFANDRKTEYCAIIQFNPGNTFTAINLEWHNTAT